MLALVLTFISYSFSVSVFYSGVIFRSLADTPYLLTATIFIRWRLYTCSHIHVDVCIIVYYVIHIDTCCISFDLLDTTDLSLMIYVILLHLSMLLSNQKHLRRSDRVHMYFQLCAFPGLHLMDYKKFLMPRGL